MTSLSQEFSDTRTIRHGKLDSVFAFFIGVYFALLQFSYFFLLEAFLSSQVFSFFVALFFWLLGFLIGLNLKSKRHFWKLLLVSIGSYYISVWLVNTLPFKIYLLPLLGLNIGLSGMLPGYYFPLVKDRFLKIKMLLFHENNGFILGVLISLLSADFAGKFYIMFVPLLGASVVMMMGLYLRSRGNI